MGSAPNLGRMHNYKEKNRKTFVQFFSKKILKILAFSSGL
jgi:hypothetical protein